MKLSIYEKMKNFGKSSIYDKRFVVKRIGAVLAASMVAASFSGCNSNKAEGEINTTISLSSTVDDNIEEDSVVEKLQSLDLVYDFPFIEHKVDCEEIKSNDWSTVIDKLKSSNGLFVSMLHFDNTPCDRNFELALLKLEKWSPEFVGIVDKNGILNRELYRDATRINDYMSVLCDCEHDNSEMSKCYILFNHNTGETKEISANYIMSINDDFFCKSEYCYDTRKYRYELLYSDGGKAIDKTYDNLIKDIDANKLYLVKDNDTEIVNLSSGEARRLEGIKVRDAYNNYFVYKDSEKEKMGVYYLDDLGGSLEEKIPCAYYDVSFLGKDSKPTFICESEFDNRNCEIYSSDNKKLSTQHGFTYACGASFAAEYTNDLSQKYGYVINDDSIVIIDKYGKKVSSDLPKDVDLRFIVSNNTILYSDESDSDEHKYGIMDFDGNIIEEACYDEYELYRNQDNEMNVILRNNEQDETVIYNCNLDAVEIARGDYDICESYNLASKRDCKVLQKYS